MMRKFLMITIVSFSCLFIHSQELPENLRQELARSAYIAFWEERIPLKLKSNQRYPHDFEEAKHWLREAANCSLLADILRADMKKPKELWAPFYRRAIFLAKGVYEKFGEFLYGWLRPENPWLNYGDVAMFIDQYFEESVRWLSDPERSALDPFQQLYHTFTTAVRIASKGEKLPPPIYGSTSPLGELEASFYGLGEWRKAMEVVEEKMILYPLHWIDGLFERWLRYATKVYRKGELPTKFLLVQNPKFSQHGSVGLVASKIKRIAVLLHFKKGHHYVPLLKLALYLGWKVEKEGKKITFKTQDREVRLEVGSKIAYVNGFKVKMNDSVWEGDKEVWLPLQFIAMIAKGRLKWERGKGFIEMVLPE